MLLARELTERVIGLAIEVHRLTGPGLLESAYEGCLCHELEQAGIAFQRQAGIPVTYKGVQFDEGFRADILVDRQLIIEIKAVANLLPAHERPVPRPAVQLPCAAVEGWPAAICHLKCSVLLRGSSWSPC